MELQEFVEQSLVQIATGVKNAQDKLNCKDFKTFINPSDIVENPVYGYRIENKPQDIEFDVAVTISEEKTTKGGIMVAAGILGLGSGGQSRTENESISRIKFKIPILFPGIDWNEIMIRWEKEEQPQK